MDSSRDTTIGSGSLLSSSESDNLVAHHSPWRAPDENHDFPLPQGSSGVSSATRQNSGGYAQTSTQEPGSLDSLYSPNQSSTPLASRHPAKISLEPLGRESDMMRAGQSQYPRNYGDDEARYNPRGGVLGKPDFASEHLSRNVSVSGYNSSIGSRTGSQPPSRPDHDQPSRVSNDAQGFQSSRYGTNVNAPPFNVGTAGPPYTMQPGAFGEPTAGRIDSLSSQLEHVSLADKNRRPSHASSQQSPNSTSEHFSNVRAPSTYNQWSQEEYLQNDPLSPSDSSAYSRYDQSRPVPYSRSPGQSASHLSQQPSHYSQNGTPNSRGGHSAAAPPPAALNQKLRGLQQQQHGYHQNLPGRPSLSMQYDSPQQPFHLNPLASYYPVSPAPHLFPTPQPHHRVPRDPDPGGHLRSALLEDFRNNSKTNKRYDLKVGLLAVRLYKTDVYRIFMSILSSSAAINMDRDSSNKSLRPRTAMKKIKCSGSFCPTPSNS